MILIGTTRIGIPRGLFYYELGHLWMRFFEELGCQPVVSGPTTKQTVETGARLAVDEACLPVKTYFGHVASLTGAVDLLFVPRLVSTERCGFICPKFLGLPDMLKAVVPNLPPLLMPTVNEYRRPQWRRAAAQIAIGLGLTARQGEEAWQRAQSATADLPPPGAPAGQGEADLTIGVLGHPYNIYDPGIGLSLLGRLQQLGARVVTPELIPLKSSGDPLRLGKPLFWSLGRRVLRAAGEFRQGAVDGVVHLVAFGCGPDSLVGELVEGYMRQQPSCPYLLLTVDEHSGEAGLVTRLEAFVDLIRWGRAG
ncbi:MAG: acyl-CoA dehydratase activase-related protein [Bacillota bacterium]